MNPETRTEGTADVTTTGASTARSSSDAEGEVRTYDASLPFADASANLARHDLLDQLRPLDLERHVVEDATTILHELVRNGIDHGAPCEDHTLEVRWDVTGDLLTLRVTDCGSPNGACPPECVEDDCSDHAERWRSKILTPIAPDALRGRGLHLVDALSESWDVETGDSGTTVSAQVRLR